jgi:hypothetical protein
MSDTIRGIGSLHVLEVDVLAGKGPVDRREGVELVLEQVLLLGVEVAAHERRSFWGTQQVPTYTRINLEPSAATRVRFPVISEGQTRSSSSSSPNDESSPSPSETLPPPLPKSDPDREPSPPSTRRSSRTSSGLVVGRGRRRICRKASSRALG